MRVDYTGGGLRSAKELAATFPPNRQIVEGEPICHVCACGKRQHRTSDLGHDFPVTWLRNFLGLFL